MKVYNESTKEDEWSTQSLKIIFNTMEKSNETAYDEKWKNTDNIFSNDIQYHIYYAFSSMDAHRWRAL